MDKSVKFKIELETNGEKVLGLLSVSADEFKESVVNAVNEIKNMKGSLNELKDEFMVLDSVTSLVDVLNDSVGRLATQFNSFDTSMRAVNTMAGKDAEGFEVLKGQIEALGEVIPLAKEELAGGLYEVLSSGVPEDNWIDFLERSAKSAVGGIADLRQVVGVTTTMIKNYGLSWDTAGELQDKIQKTAENGVTSFEQLAAALPRVTANAATLGVSVDELLATFATLTGVSGNTAEVSTQLSAIFTALIKPSSEAAEMAELMGLKFNAAAIQASGGMSQFLSDLSGTISAYAASHGMLEQEIYGRLFGSAEALRALLPLTGELSDTFDKNVSAMAGSVGVIDAAFEQMAGSGESVTQMLNNHVSTMFDWAGSIASSIHPYLSFVAVGGQAVIGTIAMGTAAKQAAASMAALTASHKSNAVVSALSAAHTKVVALAQRILAASSVTATAGTWALNVAVTALYATLTLGISAVISGLVTLFSSMGDECGEASEQMDVLQESTDAFNHSVSDAKAAIDMELVSLRTLIQQKADATEKVDELNRKYGESMGQYRSVSEWYDVLTSKSKVYCQQIGYEAQAKVLASQIAAKELEKEEKMRLYGWYRTQNMDEKGKIHYNYETVEGGEEAYHALGQEISQLMTDIATCQNKYDVCIKKMLDAQAELTRGVNATQQEVDWQTLSYNELGKAIEEQKKKVGSLVGKNAAEAKKESGVLKEMEARYRQWGEVYGLSGSSSNNAGNNGKELIKNAKSYKELGNNLAYYKNQLEKTAPSETAEIARLTKLISETQQAQAKVKALYEAAGRPVELNTLEDIDKEIQYQQGLRQHATAENIAGIDAEIARLKALKTALEGCSHKEIEIDQIKTYEQLNAELSYYEAKLQRVTAEERAGIQRRINNLKRLRDEWDATLEAMDAPGDISTLDTLEELDKAISYYSDRQKKASASELMDLQRTIDALKRKRDALNGLIDIASMESEVNKLDGLSGVQLEMQLELIGLDGLKDKIRSLQRILADTKNPLDASHRTELERLVKSYKNYEHVLRKSELSFKDAWGSVKGVGNGIQSLTDTLKGNGNAWDKICGVVDAAIQIYEGVNSIIKIIQALTAVTTTTTAVTTASGVAATTATAARVATVPEEVAASAVATTSIKTQAMAYRELAASAFMAAHASIPFVGVGIAAAYIGVMEALVGSVAVTPFANGGLVYGPTLALMGEYAGASSNPEVIAPLDKLKSIIGIGGNDEGGTVEFRIRGRRLEGVLARENKRHKRV